MPNEFGIWRTWRRWFGQRSERRAARFLRGQGYRILAANVADTRGELDLIALDPDGNTLVVVEVRSTSNTDPMRAAQTINLAKQTKLTQATLRFLKRRHLLNHPVRFDVIAIAWPNPDCEPVIVHLRQAFEAIGRFQMYT